MYTPHRWVWVHVGFVQSDASQAETTSITLGHTYTYALCARTCSFTRIEYTALPLLIVSIAQRMIDGRCSTMAR